MLSISAMTLRGPLDAGDTWTYQETDSDHPSVIVTDVDTVIGTTTFMGNEAKEVDSVTTNNQNSNTDTDQQVTAFDSAGDYVQFGDIDTTGGTGDVDTTTDTPSKIVFPSPLTGGVTVGPITYTENDSDVSDGEASPSSTDVSITFELDSESTSPVITPAGTFEVYDITVNETDTDNSNDPPDVSTTRVDLFVDPKVGIIKESEANGAESVLQSYSLTGGGGGGGGGGGTTSGVTPAITKDTVPAAVVGGAKIKGDLSTLMDNTGTGIEKGYTVNVYASTDTTLDTSVDTLVTTVTKTPTLLGGKTLPLNIPITELPASLNGTYYLIVETVDLASATQSVTSTATVEVAPPFVTLTETLTTKLPAALVSDSPVKGGSVTLTITNSGNVASKGVTPIDITASTTSGVVGTTIATVTPPKNLNILPGKSVKVTVPIKAIPALATDNYFIVAQTTDPFAGGVSIASSASTTNIAAAFILLSGTLGPASLKTGDTLTITNNGNVPDTATSITGTLGFSTDAAGAVPAGSTVSGAVKAPKILVGKTGKIHLTAWSTILSTLTSGQAYYLTVTFDDGSGGTVLAVSTTTFTAP